MINNYYIEASLPVITLDSKIEYEFNLWGKRINCLVGMSKKPNHIGTVTFLDSEGNDTIFGNGCRFNSLERCIEYIKDDIKTYINMGLKNVPVLKINGAEIELYNKVLSVLV